MVKEGEVTIVQVSDIYAFMKVTGRNAVGTSGLIETAERRLPLLVSRGLTRSASERAPLQR